MVQNLTSIAGFYRKNMAVRAINDFRLQFGASILERAEKKHRQSRFTVLTDSDERFIRNLGGRYAGSSQHVSFRSTRQG